MLRRLSLQAVSLLLCAGFILVQGGCVALNIPSERIADPTDGGGMFGDWNKGQHRGAANQGPRPTTFADGSEIAFDCDDLGCKSDGEGMNREFGCGPLEVDPFDDSVDQSGVVKPPEIPWPRFHPVPTRPVFGPRP
ncbi:hypothetical protein CA13_13250 [Planctomycetes bacterium CA13]|uniref:Uncharacterized protein n=1 Tax=Novipirellula herctigrandis TaxID=2527986 RepID=A0A5C5YXX7_9BACT|nr:hypothetical protein CA13_13250 [Planctomycetes bacterium CA13]